MVLSLWIRLVDDPKNTVGNQYGCDHRRVGFRSAITQDPTTNIILELAMACRARDCWWTVCSPKSHSREFLLAPSPYYRKKGLDNDALYTVSFVVLVSGGGCGRGHREVLNYHVGSTYPYGVFCLPPFQCRKIVSKTSQMYWGGGARAMIHSAADAITPSPIPIPCVNGGVPPTPTSLIKKVT